MKEKKQVLLSFTLQEMKMINDLQEELHIVQRTQLIRTAIYELYKKFCIKK